MIPDLIYDVGMHNGDDTAHYLAKGFCVLAIEASPALAEQGGRRFAPEIAGGRLTILNVAIAPTAGPVTFWINDEDSTESSLDFAFARVDGAPCHPITVPGVTFQDLLRQYGVPHYLKVDIEGADIHCLRALDADDRPQYVSVEATTLELFWVLHGLGYNAYKIVDQSWHGQREAVFDNEHVLGRLRGLVHWYRMRALNVVDKFVPSAHVRAFARGSSGPFGEDTPGQWQPLEPVLYNWLHHQLGYRRRGILNMRGWFDLHATTLPEPEV